MARATFFLALATLSTVYAAPLEKRIAQTIVDSTADWVQACQAAGGGQQCGTVSQTAFMTLLAAAGPCDQQNAADQMVDLAKQLNNDANMIKFAQIFTQQPRNSPESTQVLYCQQAPANTELSGLFQCQFQGTKDTFTGGVAAGSTGTVPFGLSSLNVPRSCPASPNGGVTDGAQLTDSTQDPGLANIASIGGGSGSGASGSNSGSSNSGSDVSSSSPATATSTADAGSGGAAESSAVATATGSSSTSNSSGSGSSGGGSSSFALANGQAAQKQNAQFATLTADSSCEEGENACVQSNFAMCVGGKFTLMDCGAANGLTCAALPLVNSQGTSITCTTQADALARIQNTGATGGITGSGN